MDWIPGVGAALTAIATLVGLAVSINKLTSTTTLRAGAKFWREQLSDTATEAGKNGVDALYRARLARLFAREVVPSYRAPVVLLLGAIITTIHLFYVYWTTLAIVGLYPFSSLGDDMAITNTGALLAILIPITTFLSVASLLSFFVCFLAVERLLAARRFVEALFVRDVEVSSVRVGRLMWARKGKLSGIEWLCAVVAFIALTGAIVLLALLHSGDARLIAAGYIGESLVLFCLIISAIGSYNHRRTSGGQYVDIRYEVQIAKNLGRRLPIRRIPTSFQFYWRGSIPIWNKLQAHIGAGRPRKELRCRETRLESDLIEPHGAPKESMPPESTNYP